MGEIIDLTSEDNDVAYKRAMSNNKVSEVVNSIYDEDVYGPTITLEHILSEAVSNGTSPVPSFFTATYISSRLQLNLVSKEMKYNVENYPWRDRMSTADSSNFWQVIPYYHDEDGNLNGMKKVKNLARWRKCFPSAASLVYAIKALDPSEFPLLAGVPIVNLSYVTCISGSVMEHLAGAYVVLFGSRITDLGPHEEAFQKLKNVQKLSLVYNNSITGLCFQWLENLQDLDICGCSKLSDSCMKYLSGIRKINIAGCKDLDPNGFQYLRGIQELNARGTSLNDAALAHIAGVKHLVLKGCQGFTDAGLEHLRGTIEVLYLDFCSQITDKGLQNLAGIRVLSLVGCKQDTITDLGLQSLAGIKKLNISRCTQSTITAAKCYYLFASIDVQWSQDDIDNLELPLSKRCLLMDYCNQQSLYDLEGYPLDDETSYVPPVNCAYVPPWIPSIMAYKYRNKSVGLFNGFVTSGYTDVSGHCKFEEELIWML